MEYRRPRHPHHGVYHQNSPYHDIQNQSDSMTYSQCHPNYNDTSPWVMWQGRASSPVVSLKKGKCCSAMLGIIVFLAILTVMGIAGLAIYMGAMKLDSAQYLVFDGSLRVISGDSFHPSLSDHANEIYKKKFHFYKMLLQTIFKKSELGAALKLSTITGFAKGSLVVFFRLILDRRKIPKPLNNLEERARIVILQEFSSLIPSSPLQNLKIDNNQIYIRRHFDNKESERLESENSINNSTLQIKNGVLLKTPLHSQPPKYKSTLGELVTSKPQRTESGIAQGSFVISSSESSIVENSSTEKPRPIIEHTTKTPTSTTKQLTHKKTKPSFSTDSHHGTTTTTENFSNRFQHSPALNALLMHTQTTTRKPAESTQQNRVSLDSDLITLLPYNFSYSEEPWKPMLPENFTRYPQRRPQTTTESYNSEGVGVVEVVLDQEDIDTFYAKVPLTTEESTTINNKKEYLNLHNPLGERHQNNSFGSKPGNTKVPEKSIFGPRSNDRISSFALNIDSTKNLEDFETSIIHTDSGDIVRSLDNLSDNTQTFPKMSSTSQSLPDFPIVQQFHNLDALLRSFSLRSPYSTSSTEGKMKESDYLENSSVNLPFTLLPVRSNLGVGNPLRPRPTIAYLDKGTQSNYLKISSSLTPGVVTKHHSQKTQDTSEHVTKLLPYTDFKNYETFSVDEFTTISDYSTNYFQNYFSTISPTNFEENYKLSSPAETAKEKNNVSSASSLDYVTDVTESTSQESTFEGNTNISKFVKQSTSERNLNLTSLKEEILSTPESPEEVTTNIYDKTYMPEVYRKPKMVTQFNTIALPIKLLIGEDELKIKEENIPSNIAYSPKIDKNMTNSNSETYFRQQVQTVDLQNNQDNKSMISSNLKNNSMQDYLENVIYNISTDGSEDYESSSNTSKSSEITTFFPFFSSQINDSASDTNLASNRKYDKTNRNSITMDTSNLKILSNFSFPYNDFHDENNRNISKTVNDSLKSSIESQNILKISTQLMQSNLNENHKEEESPTKNLFSSNNYVVNKSGFTILTKLLNKIPEQMNISVKNISLQNNQSECFGNLSLKCGSGECVSALSRCNHLVDCTDGSDEKNCSCAEFLQSQFLTRKICDGVIDCWDFSDENNCEWCVPGQFVCTNSRVCIDRSKLCDGERDCPNGDDEKNCVAITPDLPQANTLAYISKGYLMIRKSGHWGKLCTENFDSMNHNFKTSWSMEDLGKAVCKSLTFRKFESANIVNDNANNQTSYFELSFTKSSGDGRNTRTSFSFARTNCSKKEVVHVGCSDLECGIRPQANTQWTSKRVSGSTRHSRIVGGGNAGPGSWPWQAALYKEGEFQCGATLISDKWLLSAGHCFYHALDDFWVARLGALRRGTSLPSPYEQLQPVSRIILHPGYVDAGFINDISLLEMKNPVSFTNYVRPICLPEPTMQVKDGTLCTVVGWGQLFEVGRIFPDTLQEVQLPIISTAECRKRTLFLPLYRVTENMFCAGYDRGGRDACLGDSGGPLMCQELDGRWSLLGVTSNGYGCARANRPGVYTKVSNYVNWVRMNMASTNSTLTNKRNLNCSGHRCPLGECLSPARICNGYMECSDGSDEKDCW